MRRARIRVARGGFHLRRLLLFGLLASVHAQETNAVAYVFDVSGQWRTAPQFATDLVRGQAVNNGEVIELRGDVESAFIYIGFIDGSVENRDCRTLPKECSQPLKIAFLGSSRSISERLRDIWNRLTLPDSPTPVFTMSRGAATPDATEAVLNLRGARPDFAPALASVAQGDYIAELRPLDGAGSTARLDLHWTPPQAIARGGAVKAGLYELQLREKSSVPGQTAMVLVTRSGVRLQADFAEAAAVTKNWPEAMTGARRVYLAAVLKQLAAGKGSGR